MWPMVEAEMVVSFAGVDDLYMNETQVRIIQIIPKEQVKVMQDTQELTKTWRLDFYWT